MILSETNLLTKRIYEVYTPRGWKIRKELLNHQQLSLFSPR